MRTLTNDTDFYISSDLMVYSNGYEECESGHCYGPCRRNSWLLHYVSCGRGIFRSGERTWQISAGDLFLCIPGQEIYYEADEEQPWGYGWIGIQGSKAAEYFARTTLLEEPVVRYQKNHALSMLFVQVQQAYLLPDTIRDLRLNSLAYQLMEFLILQFPADTDKRIRQETVLVQKMICYVMQHLSETIRSEDICREIGVSRSYASRLFTRICRIPLRDYIWQTRESEACRLLRDTSLSIGSIAARVGYDDAVYFSRLFHQKTGLTPTEYRRGKRLSTRNKPKS